MNEEQTQHFPRLRDLPIAEREAFRAWLLRGHTTPACDPTEPQDEWDWYYPWDYAAWLAGDDGRES